jgi:hypothetical protein
VQIGTSYFITKFAALEYYAYEAATSQDIDRKIAEGLIHIGEPPLKPGQRLTLVDDGLRYGVIED